jgi:cell division protein FtsL
MKTINLLPKLKQQDLHYEIMLSGLWTVVILSLISFALVFLAQFGTKLYLQAQTAGIKNQITELQGQVNKQQNTEVKAKVAEINNFISDYKNLQDASPKWSKVIKAFVVLPPAGIKINSFTVDFSAKAVNITGISPTRDLVISLYNNILADSKDFYKVNYPLENVLDPKNVNFHFTFYVQDKLMQ